MRDKRIIDVDIEKYTGFLEVYQFKLYGCFPDDEAKYKKLINLHKNVLSALEELRSAIDVDSNIWRGS